MRLLDAIARALAAGVLLGFAGAAAHPSGERNAYLSGWVQVPVYDFDRLSPGAAIAGPAMFESATTTVLIRAGEQAVVTPHGWLDIRLGL